MHERVQVDLLEELYTVVRARVEGKRKGTPIASFRKILSLWNSLSREGHDLVSVLCALSDLCVEKQTSEDEEEAMSDMDLFRVLELLSSMCDQVMVMKMDPKIVFFRFTE